MSRRRNLERHRESLAEIREIMNSMKTLAYMETRKLDRLLDSQRAVVRSIVDVAADLIGFHPGVLPETTESMPVVLVLGTERGFCGDFNRALVRYLDTSADANRSGGPLLIAIGRRLHMLLEGDKRVVARIDGAGVMEEVMTVLDDLSDEMITLQSTHGALDVFCLYHAGEERNGEDGDGEEGVVMRRLLPPFQDLKGVAPRFPHAPILNLSPSELLTELTDQYLFAMLHAMLYASLMLENHHRVTHLEGAVNHLDERSEELQRQSNALRQEDIIEEIEVILLSAASLTGERGERNGFSTPELPGGNE